MSNPLPIDPPPDIYLRHHEIRDWYRIACDEDTKYYLFNDAAEPVGLLASPKAHWERVTEAEFQWRPSPPPAPSDATRHFMDAMLLAKAAREAQCR